MKKIYLILIFLSFASLYAQNNLHKSKIDEQETVEYKIKELEIKYNLIEKDNDKQLEYYKENLDNMKWFIYILTMLLSLSFLLFTYFIQKPTKILSDLKFNQLEALKIKNNLIELKNQMEINRQDYSKILENLTKKNNDANRIMFHLEKQYKNQENFIILNSKPLFNYSEKDWEMVYAFSKNALQIEEENRSTNDWIFIGLTLFKEKDYIGASRCFNSCLEIDKKNSVAWKHLGNSFVWLKDYNEAKKCYYKMLEINPKDAFAYNNIGLINCNEENFEDAEENFIKAISLSPETSFFYTNYFEMCLINNNEFKKDIEDTFLKKCSNDLNALSSYEMLSIYKKIIKDDNINLSTILDDWKKQFSRINFDENFEDVEKWISKNTNPIIKTKLNQALYFFKNS